MFVSAVVPAAGYGLRLNSPVAKTLLRLNQKPIFIHTLSVLSRHPHIKEIILVVSESSLRPSIGYLSNHRINKLRHLIIGGLRRRDSVRNGLQAVSPRADLVLVHDAVRPFIDSGMISRVIKAAKISGAAVPGVPVKSTLKEINARGRVIRTLKRERIMRFKPRRPSGEI